MSITRQDAIAEIMKTLSVASDEEIADTLYALLGNRILYNYTIVDSYQGHEDWCHYTPGALDYGRR
jgi:hypothetical protein